MRLKVLESAYTQQVPQVLGLANWSTSDGVNYAHSEARSLVRLWDFPVLALALLILAVIWGDVGLLLCLPTGVAYGLITGSGRAIARTRLAAQVACAIDAEASRICRPVRTLH